MNILRQEDKLLADQLLSSNEIFWIQWLAVILSMLVQPFLSLIYRLYYSGIFDIDIDIPRIFRSCRCWWWRWWRWKRDIADCTDVWRRWEDPGWLIAGSTLSQFPAATRSGRVGYVGSGRIIESRSFGDGDRRRETKLASAHVTVINSHLLRVENGRATTFRPSLHGM